MNKSIWYFLNEDKTIRPCTVEEWEKQFRKDRHVGHEIINNKRVSTVWLGIDHGLYGKPELFETMVFEDPNHPCEIYCKRYATWDEAAEGHKKAIDWVIDGCCYESR